MNSLIATLLTTAALVPNDDQDARTAAKYGWMSDYQLAKKRAQTLGRPLMVVFRCVP